MLLAVEGGGFFSSSASGYSKGLTLLLLGQKNEEKPMRVAPWNHYQLVGQETDPDLQLASGKHHSVRGCASLVCFGRAAAGLESPSHPKVGPAQNQGVLPGPAVLDENKDQRKQEECVVHYSDRKIISLKSSLKKPEIGDPIAASNGGSENNNADHAPCGKENDPTCQVERRKVQWTDTTGGELFEIREFEMRIQDSEYCGRQLQSCCCLFIHFLF